ncbi:MAG: efflux RND transporter periplasmic adaptor subunit [Opitutales bacterium]
MSQDRSSSRLRWQWLLILGVIVVTALLTTFLLLTREGPQEAAEPANPGTLVETVTVQRTNHRLVVDAQGTVEPARTVRLRAQVSGKVTEVSEALEPGREVAAGDILVQIDPRDYEIALGQARAGLVQAQAAFDRELGRRAIAREEWNFFQERAEEGNDLEASRELALREPQLASAEARVKEARSLLEQARLNLARTRLEAPFDAIVEERTTAPGQLVNPQQPVATLVASDRFWVRVAVPVSHLASLRIPRDSSEKGSKATVFLDLGNERVTYEGRLFELLPGLDPTGRMAQVLVTVEAPLPEAGRSASGADTLPLLLNAYVDVELESPEVESLIRVPREALRGGDALHLYEDGRLAIVTPEIVWGREDSVLVGKGLQEGAQVITSSIAAPIEGMPLRLPEGREERSSSVITTTPGDAGS